MKQFGTIFKFELLELMKTKAYKITTIIFMLFAIIGLSLPSIFPDMLNNSTPNIMDQFTDKSSFVIFDENNIIKSNDTVKMMFPNATIKRVDSKAEMEKLIKEEKADFGFNIKNDLEFEYCVLNSDMTDVRASVFAEAMTLNYKNQRLAELGVNDKDAMAISTAQTTFTTKTIGYDGANNIFYSFILIMAIYMVIILYGNIIATNVASEKGNRTMELLVTSARPNALIFGKVLAGCLAAIIQIGILIGSAKLTYVLNADAWKGMLDMVFNIPLNVLGAFAAFGILGFIFYAFIFGALGALVSKVEDVNSSATPVTIIFIAIYFVVYMGVMDASSPIFTAASFIPFSSPMAMFSRMAMVDVPLIEVLISLAILVVSTFLAGFAAAKIYRHATLMYGNPVKLSHALKWITKKEK